MPIALTPPNTALEAFVNAIEEHAAIIAAAGASVTRLVASKTENIEKELEEHTGAILRSVGKMTEARVAMVKDIPMGTAVSRDQEAEVVPVVDPPAIEDHSEPPDHKEHPETDPLNPLSPGMNPRREMPPREPDPSEESHVP